MNYAVIAAKIKKTIISRNTKSIIAALLLTASGAFAQVPSYVPTNGLVGWWPFNGNANDESGNGNNGIVNGATLTSDRSGQSNKAFDLNGTTNQIQIPHNNTLNFNGNITISSWFNADSLYITPGIVSILVSKHRIGLDNDGFAFGLWGAPSNSSGSLNFQASPNYNGLTQPNLLLVNTNLWYHFLITYTSSSGSLKYYLNGTLLDDVSVFFDGNTNNYDLVFGATFTQSGNGFGGFFNGTLDDIGIWNRALTQQEITALYNSQSCTSNTITADGPTTFCAGNYVNLTSDVVGGTYQWKKNGVNITTNGTSRTYKATATGSYTCVATCNGTALTSNTISVTSKTNAFASVSASGATSFCAGDSVTLNCTNLGSNYSVQWYRTNISMENATAYSQVVKQPGTYKVVTKNLTTGCSRISGSSVVVAVNCRLANPDVITNDLISTDLDAKVAGEDAKGKIYIYPNPTSDNKFTVELMGLELDGAATLEVYNAMGQILSSEKVNITNGTLNRTIQIDEQSKGQLCLVRLIAGSEVYDSKVILK